MTSTAVPTSSGVRTLSNHIGGAWAPASGDATLEDRDPATGALLAQVPLSTAADVDAAVRAARAALPAWRRPRRSVRARAVMALRDVLDDHRDELAELVTRDMGKTLDDAPAEVGRGIESVEAAMRRCRTCSRARTWRASRRGVDVEMVRQPVGVVAAITPFNFPAMIPLWFLPYAVAAGNAFILKPSEQDPLAAERIVRADRRHRVFPAGLINLVHGAHDVVDALLEHPGSTRSRSSAAPTARYVATRARRDGKRVQALGGAKNPMVVMPDADPGLMVERRDAAARSARPGSAAWPARWRCWSAPRPSRTPHATDRRGRARAARRRRRSTPRPTSARWSPRRSASGSSRRSTGPRPTARRSSWTAAATAGPAGCALGADDHRRRARRTTRSSPTSCSGRC